MSSLPILFSILFFFSSLSQATVPNSKTFNFVVGRFSDDILYAEAYGLAYTDVPIKTHPFALCVYGVFEAYSENETALTLAVRLDTRVVWQANRYKPVGVSSTVTFGRDGNLVLANANGNVVWQTNTANKGVVDIKLLQNGNLVLVDNRGSSVWQSFDHPTDTIVVDQSLLPSDQNKLRSRVSPYDNRNGPYSVVIEGGNVFFYYKSKQSSKPEIYSLMESVAGQAIQNTNLTKMTLQSGPVDNEPFFFYLKFNFSLSDGSAYSTSPQGLELKFNTTYSLLQLGQDGNLRIYTYFDKVVTTTTRSPWDETFTMFSKRRYYESECQLPNRCGEFGVCEDNQCVACPTAIGLAGWSNKCASPKLPPCNSKSGSNVDYYKIDGIDHFSSNFSGYGPVKLGECRDKCTKDCKCSGFFYRKETSKCLVTSQLNTLTRVSNATHQAFIKFSM